MILVAAGEEWRGLTASDKKPYEKLSQIEHQKYDVAMAEYKKVRLGKKIVSWALRVGQKIAARLLFNHFCPLLRLSDDFLWFMVSVNMC